MNADTKTQRLFNLVILYAVSNFEGHEVFLENTRATYAAAGQPIDITEEGQAIVQMADVPEDLFLVAVDHNLNNFPETFAGILFLGLMATRPIDVIFRLIATSADDGDDRGAILDITCRDGEMAPYVRVCQANKNDTVGDSDYWIEHQGVPAAKRNFLETLGIGGTPVSTPH